MKKAVNVEAKVAFQPRATTWKIDQNYPWGNRPAHSTVAKANPSSLMKDLRSENQRSMAKN